MKRKLQVALNDDSWSALDALTKEANEGFKNGFITFSDVVNEVIVNAKIDMRALQAKHTNIRKSLRLLAAQKEIDIDSAIRNLMDLKAKGAKRSARTQSVFEGADL